MKPPISLTLNRERSAIETFVGDIRMDAFSRKLEAHDEFLRIRPGFAQVNSDDS